MPPDVRGETIKKICKYFATSLAQSVRQLCNSLLALLLASHMFWKRPFVYVGSAPVQTKLVGGERDMSDFSSICDLKTDFKNEYFNICFTRRKIFNASTFYCNLLRAETQTDIV